MKYTLWAACNHICVIGTPPKWSGPGGLGKRDPNDIYMVNLVKSYHACCKCKKGYMGCWDQYMGKPIQHTPINDT